MQRKGANISLSSFDDIFSTEESRQESRAEKIQEIPLSELHPFKNHPFKVNDDEQMAKTVESVREYGVLVPAIARPLTDGGYELISGHRRHHASELAGKETMPVIVKDLDDDQATILMVDSNLQREEILPSERAFAFKMKMEALKHQGERTDITSRQVAGKPGSGEKEEADLTSCQVGTKLRSSKKSSEIIGQQTGESPRQVQRFIRLTNLIPELLDMVDNKKISFNPAVELSYLSVDEQEQFVAAMKELETPPSLSQAQRLKRFSQEGKCTQEVIQAVLEEDKKAPLERVVIDDKVLRKYFPKSYTPKQMEDQIIRLLEQWQKKRNRQQEL